MTAPTVYIAGPMRGIAEFNFPAFDRVALTWRKAGYNVISPAEHDRENGFVPVGMTGHEDLAEEGFDLKAALLWDFEQIANADGIVMLPGWAYSSGARAELSFAAALGKWAFDAWSEALKPPHIEDVAEQHPAALLLDGYGLTGRSAPEVLDAFKIDLSRGEYYWDEAQRKIAKETRVVNAATGGEKGSKLARFDLIPAGPLTELAEHFGRGAEKYEDRNWERGYDWSLSFAAMMRHAWSFWGGEDLDPETGSKHVIAAAWHAFALAHFMDNHPDLDNRPNHR